MDRHRIRQTLLVILFFLALAPVSRSASGQSQDTTALDRARQAYQNLNYAEAEQHARAALAAYETFSLGQISEVHVILGLITYARNDLESARKHFEVALRLNPSLEMDPLLVSPKILAFFDEIKAGLLVEEQPQTEALPPVEDLRPAAALRSMLIPGWGQFYKEDWARGWVFSGLWSVAAGGAIFSHIQMLDANAPDGRERHRWLVMRNGFIAAGAGIWLFSYLDALLHRSDPDKAPQSGFSITPEVNGGNPRLRASYRF